MPHRCRDCLLNQQTLETISAEPSGGMMRVTISFLVDPHLLVEESTVMIRRGMELVRQGTSRMYQPEPVVREGIDQP